MIDILCIGDVTDTTVSLLSKYGYKDVLGVSLEDLLYTLNRRGVEHFKRVNRLIIMDSALSSLLELEKINSLLKMEKQTYYFVRNENALGLDKLHSDINVISKEKIALADITQVLDK